MNTGKAIGVLIFAFLANLVGLTMNSLQLVATKGSTTAVVFVLNLYRAWTFALAPLFIKSMFRIQYFGRLVGILRITLGISSVAIIGLSEVPKRWPEFGFSAVFISFIITVVLTFSFPINGFFQISWKKNRSPINMNL